MKKLQLTILAIMSLVLFSNAQNQPAYQLYNNKGKLADYDKMIKNLAKSDMVFFGEAHTNPISHWMQIEMAKSFFEIKGDKLFFGAEMFENPNQLVLNEYLAGFYPEKKMIPEMTQMWGNYKTDYKPLVEFAKENNLRFIATNIPRRYASMINKGGMDALKKLSPEAKALIGPDLEKHFDTIVYADMKDMMGGHIPPNMLNIQTAQASKDATMAHFIMKNWSEGKLTIHYNGSYHSNNFQGIIWYIRQSYPDLNILTIANEKQDDLSELNEENLNIASYVLCVHSSMTSTR